MSPAGTVSGTARNGDERFSLQHVRDGVERRGVLTQRLAFVEREQRHRAAAALEQDAADHRPVLIGRERQPARPARHSGFQCLESTVRHERHHPPRSTGACYVSPMDPLAGSQWSASRHRGRVQPVGAKCRADDVRRGGADAFARTAACSTSAAAPGATRCRSRASGGTSSAPTCRGPCSRRREPGARSGARRSISWGPGADGATSGAGPQLRPRHRARHLESRAFRPSIPRGRRRSRSGRQARRGTVRVHVLATHASAIRAAGRRRIVRLHRVLRRAAMLS